jgi:phosphatidylglycerophosphate synthase
MSGIETTVDGDNGSREPFRATLRRLSAAQKPAARGAPAYSIYVNRKLGRFLAAAAWRAGLTPNGVTAISASFTFAGLIVIVFVPTRWWVGIIVAACLVIGYALDSADGQLARLRGGGSLAGEWLDHFVDSVKASSLHLAVLIAWFRFYHLPNEALLLIPIGFAIVAAVEFFAMILNDQLKAVHSKRMSGGAPPPLGGSTLIRSLLVSPTDYGLMCVVFVLFGFPVVFVVIYSLMFLANAGHLVLAARKWFNDMRRLDRERAKGGTT